MVVVTRGAANAVFAPDGTLKSGWVTDKRQIQRLGNYLEEAGTKLCNPVGTDLTHGIVWSLKYDRPTDVLIKAENGVYQAVLMGDKMAGTFYVAYLCSVSPGAGMWLLDRVKDYIKTKPAGMCSITLHPMPGSTAYYTARGFVEAQDGDIIWQPPVGGRRKTRRKQKLL